MSMEFGKILDYLKGIKILGTDLAGNTVEILVTQNGELKINGIVYNSTISSPPEGKQVTKIGFSYNSEGDIDKIYFYQSDELLFKLTFSYDSEKNVIGIERQ